MKRNMIIVFIAIVIIIGAGGMYLYYQDGYEEASLNSNEESPKMNEGGAPSIVDDEGEGKVSSSISNEGNQVEGQKEVNSSVEQNRLFKDFDANSNEEEIILPKDTKNLHVAEKYYDLITRENKKLVGILYYPGGDMVPSEMYFYDNGLLVVDSGMFTKEKDKVYFIYHFSEDYMELNITYIDDRVNPQLYSNEAVQTIPIKKDQIVFGGWVFFNERFTY